MRVQIPPWAPNKANQPRPHIYENEKSTIEKIFSFRFKGGNGNRKNFFFKSQVYSRAYFEKYYQKLPQGFLVAERNGKIVGYIIGNLKKNLLELVSLAVVPGWRKKGIRANLTDTLINQSKEKRVREVSVHVRTWNKEALNFYTNLEFKIIERIENYYPNGNDAYLMKREI